MFTLYWSFFTENIEKIYLLKKRKLALQKSCNIKGGARSPP